MSLGEILRSKIMANHQERKSREKIENLGRLALVECNECESGDKHRRRTVHKIYEQVKLKNRTFKFRIFHFYLFGYITELRGIVNKLLERKG